MGMVGDLSRYTQFQVAQSIPTAAASGGAAGAGVGVGAGIAMGQAMGQAIGRAPRQADSPAPGSTAPAVPAPAIVCARCQNPLDRPSKFCPECGAAVA